MTKKEKNNVYGAINGSIILIGLYFIFKYSLSFYFLIGLLLFSILVSSIIVSIIPSKKKSTKKQPTNKKKSQSIHRKNNDSKANSKVNSEKVLLTADIGSLSGPDFERLVCLYFKAQGFNPEIMGGSGDHGVDIVMKDPKDGMKIAVQCKRWDSKYNIGNGDIIKLQGGKRFYGCPGALFITTSNYTSKAKEFAEQCKIELWNGLHVDNKINKWRKQKVKKIS